MQALLQKYKWFKYLLLVAGGALTCLTLVFPQVGFLEWFSMIPAAAVLIILSHDESVKYKTMYKYGWVYFMSFFVVAFHWFAYLYPLSFIDGMTKGTALIIVLLGCVGLSALQTSVAALFPVMLALGARRGLCKKRPMLLPLFAASVYTVLEWMQTLTWAGVPWARLAIGQTASAPMLKTASLLGSYLLTFLIVAVNFFLGYMIVAEEKKAKQISVAVAGLIIAVNGTVGGILVALDSRESGEKFTAAAIQPNISSHEKWSDTFFLTDERVEKYCLEAAEAGAELIVLPESVYPYTAFEYESSRKFLTDIAVKCNATLVVGTLTVAESGENQNSLVFVTPDGEVSETVYSKRHLVPFGEYVPWRKIIMTVIPPLAEISMLGDDLLAGEGSAIYDSEVGALGSLICFDSIYENLMLETVRDGAEIIVISTNDSWFYDSAGVRMHNAQASIRAVESGRYIVRSANTGISSIIDPNGRVLDSEPALIDGYAISEIALRQTRTLYSYVGNLLVLLCGLYICFNLMNFRKIKCE